MDSFTYSFLVPLMGIAGVNGSDELGNLRQG